MTAVQAATAPAPRPHHDSLERAEAARAPAPASPTPITELPAHAVTGLAALARRIDDELPSAYRTAAFEVLAPRYLNELIDPLPVRREGAADPLMRSRVELGRYGALLDSSGRNLMKALAALEAAQAQFDVRWMTPREIERFLVDRASVRGLYRTNISNALRAGRGLVDRRRRGRAYEYRLTPAGAAALARELKLVSS